MTPEEMAQVRPRLVAFAAEMLGGLARSDQRAKGELYLRGLMLDGKRKSMQPMAARLGVDHQQLQQFVTSSTWDHVGVRKRIARWADEFIDPDAYVIDDTGFPKDGADSPGVARMYSGTLGKVGNCQIGVSVHAVTDWASAAIDWRLFLPKSWDDTTTDDTDLAATIRRRRVRCKIPDPVRHREKWRLALDMLDEVLGEPAADGWGLPARPVVGDAGYGDATEFRRGLAARACPMWSRSRARPAPTRPAPCAPPYAGRGRPPTPRYRDEPTSLAELALAAGRRCPRSPGATARERMLATRPRRCGPGSWRCGFARPIATFPATRTAASTNAGCWSNGHPVRASPPITGCPTCRPIPRCATWCGWPRSAGGSSTTTGN